MENLELARKVERVITKNARLFDMRTYGTRTACGTAACIAGHTLLIAGYEMEGDA